MEPAQSATYPNLAVMALDILPIPAMSADPEHLFSWAAITITEKWNRLGVSQLRHWSAQNPGRGEETQLGR